MSWTEVNKSTLDPNVWSNFNLGRGSYWNTEASLWEEAGRPDEWVEYKRELIINEIDRNFTGTSGDENWVALGSNVNVGITSNDRLLAKPTDTSTDSQGVWLKPEYTTIQNGTAVLVKFGVSSEAPINIFMTVGNSGPHPVLAATDSANPNFEKELALTDFTNGIKIYTLDDSDAEFFIDNISITPINNFLGQSASQDVPWTEI